MFGHEKLDVYQLSIDYVAWVFAEAKKLSGIHRHARDQRFRASQSHKRKSHLDRIAAMLSKLGGRGYRVMEEAVAYGAFDSDTDSEAVKS